MKDLNSVKLFLSSLSPVSRTHYQIWNTQGKMVFSTGDVMPKEFSVKAFQNLSHLIIDQKAFQYRVYEDENFMCGIPIKNSHGVLGALVACDHAPYRPCLNDAKHDAEAYHADEMKKFFSNLIILVEENLNANEEVEEMALELEQNFEDLYSYGQIATQIKTVRFSTDMLKELMQRLIESFRVDAAVTRMPNKPEFNMWFSKPKVFETFSAPHKFLGKLISMIPPDAPSIKENYFIINDSRKNPQYKDLSKDVYRFLAVRVQHHKEFYGWIGLVSFNLKEIFRQGELKLLISMAEQLAGAITNTDLYNDLEQFVINMVKSLVFAIEAKDIYTRGHSERVSKYSILMGKQLGLNEKEFNDLKWASMLHDIGKIGIPEFILNKPDGLTDAEYEIIRGHPEKGGEILRPVAQLAGSLPGIIHHHEHYDGTGYPQGLKGEEIPLSARIIAVADTFDAITSSRAYRRAKRPEKALTIIEEVAGTQLDARMVDVFKKVYKENIIYEDLSSQ